MPIPPEEPSAPEASQPTPESPSPVVEAPAEAPPVSVEATPAPETDQPATPTGQIGGNDPLPQESDPIKTPEPPSAAAPAQTSILHTARELLAKARVTMQDRKRKKRDKIMEALGKKNKITNDEVEKLLRVSDATAERYLAVLVKEGKLKQEKRTGAGVSYSRAP